eukprot:m.287666 g.287666  ORF g.287666 m.287666 type:complete len:428 (+) comp11824_c0_seq1:272-1555(+)
MLVSVERGGGVTKTGRRGEAWQRTVTGLLLLGARLGSDIELEEDDVAVLDNVVFAFKAVLSGGADLGDALLVLLVLGEIRVVEDLGLDKSALKIRVDDTSGLGCSGTLVHSPAADFLFASGEKVDEVELVVALNDDLGEHRLDVLATFGQKSLLGGIVLLGGELLFKLDGKGQHGAAAVLLDPLVDLGEPLVLLAQKILLGDVGEVDDGLGGAEIAKLVLDELNLGGRPFARANGEVLLEHLADFVRRRVEDVARLGRLGAAVLVLLGDSRLEVLQILLAELLLDRVEVADGVNAVVNVDDGVVIKSTDYVVDAVHSANVRKKGIAQTGALRGALDEAGNVGNVEPGRHPGRSPDTDKIVKALVWNSTASLVGVDGAEGKVGCLGNARAAQQVEEAALAHVGQPHNAHAQRVLHAPKARACRHLLCS